MTFDRGNDKSILLSTYIASRRLSVEYAAAAWLPWVSPSTMENQKTRHRHAGREITGQIKTTHVEAILA